MIHHVSLAFACDGCGRGIELRHPTYDPKDAKRKLRVLGWKVRINGHHELCPACAAAYAKRIKTVGAARERLRARKAMT